MNHNEIDKPAPRKKNQVPAWSPLDRAIVRASLIACLSIVALLPAQSAQAAPTASAKQIEKAERFAARAFKAYGRKNYRQAVALYNMAYHEAPGANILYNLARIFDLGLRDRTRAIRHYRRFLDHPSATRPQSEYAALRIDELQAIQVTERNALNPAAPAPRSNDDTPPQRSLGASTRGFLAPSPTSPALDAPPNAWSARQWAGIATAGVGIASLAVGTHFGLSAYSERDNWREDCVGNVCETEGGVEAARSAYDQANVATIALATGGGLLALGSALFWVGTTKEKDPSSVALGLPRAGLGCSVSGRF